MDYIIIVDGAYSSGKTTFVQTLCGEVNRLESVEKIVIEYEKNRRGYIRSLAIYGALCLDLEVDKLYLIAIPDVRRFDYTFAMLDNFCVLGAVIFFNSLIPETFRESRSILETWRAYLTQPVFAVANYQDDPYVLSAEEIGALTQITVPILPCAATQKESVKAVLIQLLEATIA